MTATPLLLLVIFLLCVEVASRIGEDGMCSLHVYVPFTLEGKTNLAFQTNDWRETNAGFSLLAAFVMAAKQFNERNSSVIAELVDHVDCPVKFDLNNTLVFNTDGFSHDSSRSFFETAVESFPGSIPCAIIGPFSDFPAEELSVMAQAAGVPMVAVRNFNVRTTADMYSPFTSSVFPDCFASAKEVAKYLVHKDRTDFIALLYSMTEAGYQRRESLGLWFDNMGITWMSSPYLVERNGTKSTFSRTHRAAMQRIKDSGYRTIVVALNDPFIDLDPIANAAEELGMLDGTYFYVFYDIMEPIFIYDTSNEAARKLLVGSAWITPMTKDYKDETPFMSSWADQGADSVDILNRLNPILDGNKGYVLAKPDFYQMSRPQFGSAYIFDAVMAAGIGACEALSRLNQTSNSTLTGEEMNAGVRLANFVGTSGNVAFGNDDIFSGGSRKANTSMWAGVNFLHPEDGWFVIADLISPDDTGADWIEQAPFVYAGNTTAAPTLLRDTPEQNYLPNPLRIIGFCCMGMVGCGAIASALWVFLCRKHRVLTASQPFFLYAICFGAIVQGSTIFSISFDESQGWSENQLSMACMSVPWLLCLGHTIVYSALFTKLWRIQRVLSFTRRKVEIKHVAAPMVGLLTVSTAVLVAWTVASPLYWWRKEIDSVTGESIGMCQSDAMEAFLIPLVMLMLIPLLLTGWLAFQTRDVDEAYTESWWIFVLILLQTEVLIVAAPVIVILRNESVEGRYMGFCFLLWTFPMSTLLLIMVPKILAYRRAIRGIEAQQTKRGKLEGTRVTGLPAASTEKLPSPSRVSYVTDESGSQRQQFSDPPPRSSASNPDNDLSIPQKAGLPVVSEQDEIKEAFPKDEDHAPADVTNNQASPRKSPSGESGSVLEI